MIIDHVPDPDGTPHATDTDKLGDVPAALLEAAENFRRECIRYKRQFFLVLNPKDLPSGGAHTFWSYLSEHMTPPELFGEETSKKRMTTEDEAQAFYSMIFRGVYGVSDGRFLVVLAPVIKPLEKDELPPDN